MSKTYLTATYKDKDVVKSLGGRWDADARRWFVPDNLDLAAFQAWLPAESRGGPIQNPVASTPVVAADSPELSVALPGKGIRLSQLMAGVAKAVADAYKAGVWTIVEVLKVDVRRGHVYLELTERSADGESVAQARAMIWESVANRVVPAFEKSTGIVLGSGIKLLVRAKPTMHAQYGFSLVIDDIDPDYTLGDLEARKREIRARLQREGLFEQNKKLSPPWDYNHVLVVAPQGAAGLGDVQAEASRLEDHGICQFTYAFSRFQGEGAPQEIVQALHAAMDRFRMSTALPDAVAIIRGGGAVNDLAWLNDYDLARTICELEVPVLTGIGHERDNTILDDVVRLGATAQLGIAQRQVPAALAHIEVQARRVITAARTESATLNSAVFERAQGQIVMARRDAQQDIDAVRLHAQRVVKEARNGSEALMREIAGQGPEKSLGRGFAIVSTAGQTLSSASQVQTGAEIEIQFRDGRISARTHNTNTTQGE